MEQQETGIITIVIMIRPLPSLLLVQQMKNIREVRVPSTITRNNTDYTVTGLVDTFCQNKKDPRHQRIISIMIMVRISILIQLQGLVDLLK